MVANSAAIKNAFLQSSADKPTRINMPSVEIKKILAVSFATGEVRASSSRMVDGKLVILKKTKSVVKFSIGDEVFCAGAKDFANRNQGFIYVC